MRTSPRTLVVGTVVAGSLATLTLAADVIAPENLVAVTMAGSLGSVLPDIDLKDSRPSRALFAGLAVFFSFELLFHFAPRLSIAEMWILWLATLLFVRYGLHTAFHRLTNHRGVWHSWIAGLASAFATVIIFYYVFDRPDGVAWLAGGFLLIGFLTHLILDEIYSVDVLGNHIKRSFGTAFKPFDWRNPAGFGAYGGRCRAPAAHYAFDHDVLRRHHLAPDVGGAASAPAAAGRLVWRYYRPQPARRQAGTRRRSRAANHGISASGRYGGSRKAGNAITRSGCRQISGAPPPPRGNASAAPRDRSRRGLRSASAPHARVMLESLSAVDSEVIPCTLAHSVRAWRFCEAGSVLVSNGDSAPSNGASRFSTFA